ncbi:hypothetical protein [Hahella ganghwensis]|uniref:hypothetical protein n=1 Tax=Hahella ganghwensis TaxID=286420 RepID=UPI00037A56E5|nr:hypothetical protein [Hahella ganghwensis]
MSKMMGTDIQSLVIKKMAQEAFNMVFEGQIDEARKVFSAVNQVSPGNRPSALGLALVDLVQMQQAGIPDDSVRCHYQDPVMSCFQGLVWLQEGRTTEARALLEAAILAEDAASAELASDIIKYEIEGR